jgi:hypothetical protein
MLLALALALALALGAASAFGPPLANASVGVGGPSGAAPDAATRELLGVLNAGFAAFSGRLDIFSGRLDILSDRFDHLDQNFTGRLDRLDQNFDRLAQNFAAHRADTARLATQIAVFANATAAQLSAHSAILARHSALLEGHSALLEGHSALLEGHSALLEGHSALLADLLDATPTPRAAARVSACAGASTWLVSIVDTSPSHCISVCTAFSYERAPGAPVAFISAGHCFEDAFVGVGHAVKLERVGDGISLNCTVSSLVSSSVADDAILDCPGAAGVTGLRPAQPGRAALSLPVAAIGFFPDNLSLRRVAGSTFALTTMLARISDAAGPGVQCAAAPAAGEEAAPAAGDEAAQCVAPRLSKLVGAAGFIDRAVVGGMSGGPMLDMDCGVVGIVSARTCGAGLFVELSGVDARLARAGS